MREKANETKSTEAYTRWVKNPEKEKKYKWWQIFSKINQFLAEDEIPVSDQKDVYTLEKMQKYLTGILSEFNAFCDKTKQDYCKDINNLKDTACKMANDLVCDIERTERRIFEQQQRTFVLASNEEQLQKEQAFVKHQIDFLNEIKESLCLEE